MKPIVLDRCHDYDVEKLTAVINEQFKQLQIYEELKPEMTVVIKPNLLIKSKPESAVITHPNVVAAVGLCVQKVGAKVLIAESSGGPYTTAAMSSVFAGCEYTEMAEKYGFSLYTACESQPCVAKDAVRCNQFTIVKPFLEADYVINIAKLKTHGMMAMSAAVKNLFGCIPGLMKPELHCRFPEAQPFAEMLVDLSETVKTNLHIIDGIDGMEGNGPSGGDKRHIGVLIASKDPYGADVVAATVIGIVPETLLILRESAKRGLCSLDVTDYEVIHNLPDEVKVADFKYAKVADVDFIKKIPKFLRPLATKLVTPRPKIRRNECIGCGKCAESCPQHVIKIEDGLAVIQYQNCIRCFCCHEMCPVHVIDIKRLKIFDL